MIITYYYILVIIYYYDLIITHYYIIITSLFPIAKTGNTELIITSYALSLFSLLHCYYPLLPLLPIFTCYQRGNLQMSMQIWSPDVQGKIIVKLSLLTLLWLNRRQSPLLKTKRSCARFSAHLLPRASSPVGRLRWNFSDDVLGNPWSVGSAAPTPNSSANTSLRQAHPTRHWRQSASVGNLRMN